MLKGLAHAQKGEYREAISCYQEVIHFEGDTATAHYNIACASSLASDFETAQRELEEAIRQNPSHRQSAKTDEDFTAVRDKPWFQKLVG